MDLLITEQFQHLYMIGLGTRFLENEARGGDDYGVSADDEGWVGYWNGSGILGEGYFVDVKSFLERGLEDVFEGSQFLLTQILWLCGGQDLEI